MRLKETIEAYRRNDPAARSGWEVFWLYNGLHATMYYRVAHWLYEHRLRFLGRWVSQFARRRTGIPPRRPMATAHRLRLLRAAPTATPHPLPPRRLPTSR